MIFYINNSRQLALSIAKKTGLRLGKFFVSKFKDGEIFAQLKEDVRGKEVYILGSGNPPADNMLGLLILTNTLKENGVRKVNLIMPYFAYAKSDRVAPNGFSLNAKLMANLIKTAGADKVISINIHSKLAENFFTIPLTRLSAMPLLAGEFKKLKVKDLKVVSPDIGGTERAKDFARALGISDIVVIKKTRPAPDKVKVLEVGGDVKNKNIVIVDDMIQSGGTILKAVEILKKHGAKDIYIAVAHFLFSGPALPLISKNKSIKKVFITNTVTWRSHRQVKKLPEKFKVVRIDNLISDAILTFSKMD